MSYSKDYKTSERIDEAKNKNTNSPKETQSIGFLYRHRGLFWLGGAIIISSVIIMIFGMTAVVYPQMLESPSRIVINTASAQKKYELGKYKKAMCLFGYIAFFVISPIPPTSAILL